MKEPYSPEQLSVISDWLGSGSVNIFGLPYSGKDTQAQRLGELLNAPVLGGGDILRNSQIPSNVRDIMNSGELIPTADYMAIVLPYLSQAQFQGRPLMLSSVGRWHGEEEGVVQATEAAGHPMKAVIHLIISEADVEKRWEAEHTRRQRGPRQDEGLDKIKTRLTEFQSKTKPVLDFYEQLGLLLEIDGTQEPQKVTADILAQLAVRAHARTA